MIEIWHRTTVGSATSEGFVERVDDAVAAERRIVALKEEDWARRAEGGPVVTYELRDEAGDHPVCATWECGKAATCLGAYEGAAEETHACDTCCGHGCEDGHCEQLSEMEEPAVLLGRRGARQER